MARLLFKTGLRSVMPPWLRRTWGEKLLDSIGDQLDALIERTASGVSLRFPGHDIAAIDETALAYLSRDRRLLRGQGEPSLTFARRLRTWWDAHRPRGGPYALLDQLYAYFRYTVNVRMDVVYQSGTRRWIDAAGVITRDAITWGGDGSGKWARFWVFFHLTNLASTLVTHTGDRLVTHTGDVLIGDSLLSGTISPSDEARFLAIPREWSAAHIDRVYVVLLYGVARLWNYPQPVPTWTAWGASGAKWMGNSPVVLIAQ